MVKLRKCFIYSSELNYSQYGMSQAFFLAMDGTSMLLRWNKHRIRGQNDIFIALYSLQSPFKYTIFFDLHNVSEACLYYST